MPVIATFPRELAWETPGAFMSYGAQADLDAAFDDASLADQFDLGSQNFLPSLNGVDPNSVSNRDTPLHPHVALRTALAELPSLPEGTVIAQPVRALKDYQHHRNKALLEDPGLDYPPAAGPLWGYEEVLSAAARLAAIPDTHLVVSGELPRVGTRRYEAKAQATPGPKVVTHGVFAADGTLISEHATASLARKDALTRARDKEAGIGSWEVRPVLRKADGKPYILVTRKVKVCRIPVVVTSATEKQAGKVTVHGYLFYGKRT